MSSVQYIQSSFSEGLISPRLHGQIEIPTYKTSVKTLENFTVLPQGSLTRRPGTYFAKTAASNTANGSRLIPFNFGQGQSYILEFYNNKIRLFSNEGQLMKHDGNPPTDITTTYTTAQIPDVKVTQSADVLYLVHPAHPPRTLSRTIDATDANRYADDSVWEIQDIDFLDGPYDEINDDETKLLAVTKTTLDEVKIGGVGVDTVLDAFVISGHGVQAGMKVVFKPKVTDPATTESTAVGNLVLSDGTTPFDITDSTPAPIVYYVVNPTATSFQVSESSGGTPVTFQLASSATKWTGEMEVYKQIMKRDLSNTVTITASGTSWASTGPFTANDVGRLIRVNPLAGTDKDSRGGIRWGYVKITAHTNSKTVVGKAQNDIVLDSPTLEWRMSVFNSTDGYPETVQIYQQRLVFGGSTKYPSTVWLSKSGDFYNFAESELLGASTGSFDPTGALILGEQIMADNAMIFTIDSDTVDKITWMAEGKKLAIGTSGGVFNLYGSETDLTVTPFNFTILKDSAYPATSAEPVLIGEIILYVQQNKRKLRELKFEGDTEQFSALDLTLRAENITYTGLDQVIFQEQPFSMVWGRLGNGKLICLTYNSALQLYAWSTHIIGGSHTDATYGNHAKVESIAVIPHDNRTQLWMIVKRTINGSTVRHIEFLEKFFDGQETAQVDAHFVDSGLKKYNSSAYTSVSGLTHLEGQELLVYGDGAIQPNQTVSSGAVTISSAVNTTIIGLPYESNVVTLPMMQGPGGGTFAIGKKRMIRVTSRLLESIGMKFAMENGTFEEVVFRDPSDVMGVKVPLFTGDKEMAPISRSFESEGIHIRCDQPFPFTLLLLAMEYEVNL